MAAAAAASAEKGQGAGPGGEVMTVGGTQWPASKTGAQPEVLFLLLLLLPHLPLPHLPHLPAAAGEPQEVRLISERPITSGGSIRKQ